MTTGGGKEYEVLVPALTAHASTVDSVAEQVRAGQSAATSVQLGAGAYGLLCQVVPALIAPLQAGSAEALGEAATALHTMADAVRSTAERYRIADSDAEAGYRQAVPQ
jgi:uncharacterized protein YukE